MKHLFAKWLSALLIAALLLTPVALMEETNEALTVTSEQPALDANGGDIDNADDEETDEADADIMVEAVDESVAEAEDVDLSILEAQSEELYTDALEDYAAGPAVASALLLAAGGDVDIKSSFPDSAFRGYVTDNIDTNKDDKLSDEERSRVTEVDVWSKGIKDLTGIRLFPNLTMLDCSENQLTTLDVSGCANLTYLSCGANQLTTLNVSGCSNLTDLRCYSNQLITLNVSGCSNLTILECHYNQLATLDVSDCSMLTHLECANNQLAALSVNGCPNLDSLWCGSNKLTTLDVNGCSNLTLLYCYDNQLTTLNISACPNMRYLDCHDNLLSTLNINACTELRWLFCWNNQLASLDFIGCVELTELDCSDNSLSQLNIKNNMKLEELSCEGNPKLKVLDITNCDVLLSVVDPNAPKEIDWDDDGKTDCVGYGGYLHSYGGEGWRLTCDKGLTIITKIDNPSTAPAPAPAKPATISVVKKNNRAMLTAVPGTIFQLDLGGAPGKKFKSSNRKVATVNAGGQVTMKKAGKTTISFKVGNKTRKVKLTFKDSTIPPRVTIAPPATVFKKGDTVTLTPVVPDNTNPGGFKWKSSNKKVAAVNNGVVTFKKKGRVTITCTAKRGKKKARVTFTVSP